MNIIPCVSGASAALHYCEAVAFYNFTFVHNFSIYGVISQMLWFGVMIQFSTARKQ